MWVTSREYLSEFAIWRSSGSCGTEVGDDGGIEDKSARGLVGG